MRRNIGTDLLRTFVAVVDQDGFTKAGSALGRSQSAISMQMRRLEEAAGCRLFDRDGRRMRLTPAGELLLGYARRLVTLHDQTLDALHESEVTGPVSLAVMDDYATHVLPKILAEFIALYPGIKLEVTTGFSADLITHLGERFELVLTTQPSGSREGETLRCERTRWAFSARHVLPEDDVLPLALLPPGNLFREWALRALDEAGRRWRILFTSTSIAAVEAAAAAGIAVAVVKQGTAGAGLRLLDSDDGLPDLPSSEIVLHRAPDKPSPAAQTLAGFLVRALKAG